MYDIFFEKIKGRSGRVSSDADAAVWGFFTKKCYKKFRRIHKKKSALKSLFC